MLLTIYLLATAAAASAASAAASTSAAATAAAVSAATPAAAAAGNEDDDHNDPNATVISPKHQLLPFSAQLNFLLRAVSVFGLSIRGSVLAPFDT